MKNINLLALTVFGFVAINASAEGLKIGDAAPAIKASHWVKGSPVTQFETGKVYVVEFWATWCGPCKQSIPHLTELSHQFKDKVTFIGMDVMEDDTNVVVQFVQGMKDKMDYTVAIDTEDTHMANAWLKAAKQNGIPAAFVIDQAGKVAWIGHPMDSMDSTLTNVLAGTWDAVKSGKRIEAKQQAQELFNEGMAGGDLASIEERAKKLEIVDKEVGGFIAGKTFDAKEFIEQIRFCSAIDTFQKAVLDDQDAATVDKLEAVARERAPKDYDFDDMSKRIRMGQGAGKAQKLFGEYLASVGANANADKAAELGRKLGELKLKNPSMYSVFASTILNDAKVKQRDYVLAAKLSKTAVDMEEKNAEFRHTYAQALFGGGKVKEAIDEEKKALELVQNNDRKTAYTESLKKFEAALGTSK